MNKPTAQSHTIAVSRTARYVTLGELTENTRKVWFVLHGYGQLAEYFIRKFEKIHDEHTLIVAPEALSRFYSRGDFGRVGASWMTKEERQSEIDDYVAYLDTVREAVLGKIAPEKIQITVVGFSQGTATASRWVNAGHFTCHRLILWGGYFANGLLDLISSDRLPANNTHFVYGTEDEFLIQLNVEEYIDKLQAEIPDLKIMGYAGGHTIDADVLKEHFGS
jgi:predicted esterase